MTPTHLVLIIASCILITLFTGLVFLVRILITTSRDLDEAYKHLSDINSAIDTIFKDQEDLWFFLNSNYYDFLDHMHHQYHLTVDDNNKMSPSRPAWTLEEELKLLKFREWVKEGAEKRNLPFPLRDGDQSDESSTGL